MDDTGSTSNSVPGKVVISPARYVVKSGEESAQRQVLTNLDLLELIFIFFDIHPTGNIFNHLLPELRERKYLLWASITCRAFFEPGMSVLWRSMNAWRPLVKLLPVLIEVNNPAVYTHPAVQKELQRFDFYTQRIRHLQFFGSTYFLPSRIFPSIAKFRQFKIMPALQTLSVPRLGEISSENIPFLFLLPSPTLYQISMAGINDLNTEKLAARLLQAVCQETKIIRDIKLEGQLSSESLDAFQLFHSLQNLHITLRGTGVTRHPLSETFLRDISEIATLRSFTLTLDSQIQFIRESEGPPRPKNRKQKKSQKFEGRYIFPGLSLFEILGSATAVNDILRSMKTPNLEKIKMILSTSGQGEGVPPTTSSTLLEGLVRMLAEDMADCLESIQITSFSREVQIPHQALEWFRLFRKLKHMQTSIDIVSKETIPSMFLPGGWDALVTLKLEVGSHVVNSRKVPSSLSLSQIGILSRFCPSLTSLSLSVWIFLTRDDVRTMREEIKGTCSCHKLQELELLPFIDMNSYAGTALAPSYGSRIQDILTISRFINHIFPYLRRFDLSQLYVVDSQWCDDVSAVVKEFQEVRRAEHKCK